MGSRQRRLIVAAGALLTVLIVALSVFVLVPGDRAADSNTASPSAGPRPPTATEVADWFLAAFAGGRTDSAAAQTDDAPAAARQLAAVWRGLAPESVTATRSGPLHTGPTATTADATVQITWTFSTERVWSYPSTVSLARAGEDWRVRWAPAIVHPKLTAAHSLALVGQTGQPAVLDREGAVVLVWQGNSATAADGRFAPLLTPAMARLAGEQGGPSGWHVALVDATGAEVERLGGAAGAEARPITSTLSVRVQNAAQAAVDSAGGPAMLVAIQPSSGDILAVAQNGAAGTDPRVLYGLYPPGSTFKIVTATAVLQAGAADLTTMLPCPASITIGPRTIPNAGFELGDVPLRTAFASSCNTTFAKLAADLPLDALSEAAGQLGLNADFVIPGITTEAGAVRPAESITQQVENGIGQGTVLVSPFGLALMTATVASGKSVTPALWRDLPTTVSAGYQSPPRAVLDKIRTMMSAVVTSGTGTALARHGAVAGKTGTAQFGADGLQAHGWFVGYRGDVAFAVFVESADAASAIAVSSTFLTAG
jgi:beta-lactamase class D